MSTVATMTAVELLHFTPEHIKTTQWFQALRAAARGSEVDLVETSTYRGATPWLLMWGPGAPTRQALTRQHIARGGHVVCFDAAYWQRDQKYRVTIDAPHPQAWVMRRDWPRDRFAADQVRVADLWKPNGPIVIAGLGRKAREQYGCAVEAWERDMFARVKGYGRPVRYRVKPGDTRSCPSDVTQSLTGPIETVLTGASLVITWHSNVAVDAIRLGIPAVCVDGAAAAVCPSVPSPDLRPIDSEVRVRFLSNLAWFQWGTTADEARGCWQFLREVLA